MRLRHTRSYVVALTAVALCAAAVAAASLTGSDGSDAGTAAQARSSTWSSIRPPATYAAHDYGVLRLPAGGSSWVRAADGLPKVAVFELSLTGGKKAGDRTLYAATHGRGAYRIDLPKR